MVAAGVSVVTTTWNESENIEKLVLLVRTVLWNYPHEVIVVDDSSTDGTFEIARRVADVAVVKKREGQTLGLLYGMKMAKYPVVITIDSDLENDPKYIPRLIEKIGQFDVVSASRSVIPRVSERFASKTLGKLLGVSDCFSNFRAFKCEVVSLMRLERGETFGAEFLVFAKRHGYSIGELIYEPPPRRSSPRIGGSLRANLRIFWALLKVLVFMLW